MLYESRILQSVASLQKWAFYEMLHVYSILCGHSVYVNTYKNTSTGLKASPVQVCN